MVKTSITWNGDSTIVCLQVKQSGETWVVLQWSALEAPGQTVSYVIEIASYRPFQGWSVVKDHLFGTVAKLDGLVPNTGYYLMLRAVVDDRVGRPKLLNKVFFTKPQMLVSMNMEPAEMQQYASQMVLSSHKVSSYGANEILTAWAICGLDAIVARITQFNVIYTPVGIGNCTQRTDSAPPRCPYNGTYGSLNSIHPLDDPNFCFKNASNWHERLPAAPRAREYQEKQTKLTVDPRKPIAHVMIKELEPFTCYHVAAQAVMGTFLSQRSDVVSVLTYGQAPGQSPTHLAYQWREELGLG
ncbi:hypothetical protein Ciccas_011767 [Cichlidogyrus casuarinus]|uniref:Fibronectin type-III domain-containing protein n=1 Tax=Cichlidogyrus casuarinus TaxID=1844966 RepID=A0ABD2PQZ9_9PLAT